MENVQNTYLEACDLLEDRKVDLAEQKLMEILREDSKNHLCLNKLGAIRAGQHNFEEAKRYFKECLAINPDYAPAIVNLGNLLLEEADYEKALAYYQEALLKDCSYHMAYYNIAVAYKKMGHLDEYFANIKLYKQYYKNHLKAKNKEAMLKHGNKALPILGVLIVIVVLFFILK